MLDWVPLLKEVLLNQSFRRKSGLPPPRRGTVDAKDVNWSYCPLVARGARGAPHGIFRTEEAARRKWTRGDRQPPRERHVRSQGVSGRRRPITIRSRNLEGRRRSRQDILLYHEQNGRFFGPGCSRAAQPALSRCCRSRRCPGRLRVLRCCRHRRCRRPLRVHTAPPGRRSAPRWFGAALALASVLGSAVAGSHRSSVVSLVGSHALALLGIAAQGR